MQIALVLGLLIVTIFLFASGKYRVEIVTLGLLVVLTATRILTPAEAFAGFGSDFIVILITIFVISGALRQTGVIDLIGSRLVKIARSHSRFLLAYIMCTVGATSAFMNNTTVTAVFLAPIMSLARTMKMSASRLLMPVAFASIIGGSCTIIGTSTNIAVSGYLERAGMPPLHMFEFLPIGAIMFVVTLLYMITIGRKLLPDRGGADLTEEQELRKYVTEIVIMPDSDLVGQRIFESDLSKMGFRILNVIRNDANFLPDYSTIIQADDLLIVEGDMETLLKVKETVEIEIRADVLIAKALQSEDIRLVEVFVTPQSEFVNVSLKDTNFRQRYGLVVLAISRSGHTLKDKIGSEIIRVGDILLVQGTVERIAYFKSGGNNTIMEDFKPLLYKKQRGIFTLVVFALAILFGTLDWMPLSTALIGAVILIILTEAISAEKAFEAINFPLLILIGGMFAFGTAMTKSGAAEFLSNLMVNICSQYGPLALMTGFVILTIFLTQPMSNAAAALVVLPIAMQAAQQLSLSPKPFAIAVMLSASISLITPFEPSCILVYGPGRYRFTDFFRTGFLLTILLIVVLLIMIPRYYPF